MSNKTSPIIGNDDAANYIGVAGPTLETWRSTGRVKIPFIRIGRLVKYRISDLDNFLSKQTVDKHVERNG